MPERGLRGIRVGLAVLVAVFAVGVLVRSAGAQQEAEAEVFIARAIVAYEDKRYDEALAALRQALDLDPSSVDALYYTGLVRIGLNRLDEAAEAL